MLMAFVPAVGLGAVLPLAMGVQAESGASVNGIGRIAGRLSFLQSLGGAAGALVTGYIGLEFLGTKAVVVCAASLLLVASAAVARGAALRSPLPFLAAVALTVAGVVSLGPWRPLFSDSHVFRGRRGADSSLVAASEEALGLVSVVDDRKTGDRRLYTDGFLAAGTGPEYRYMKLLGHLPALLAETDDFRACVVCFGSGTTAGALARYPGAAEIEIAEISRRVLAFAPLFAAANHGVLSDPRVRAIVDDGRRWLRSGGDPFDIVTLEPLLPYTPSAVSLYSAEFSAVVRSRLVDGGLFCQWIPLHCIEPRDLSSLVGAIVREFPESALFVFEQSAVVIGTRGSWRLPIAGALRRGALPAVTEDLLSAGCSSSLDALAGLVLDPAGVASLASLAPPLSDDRPSLETRALPRWALASYLGDNLFTLLELAAPGPGLVDWAGVPESERETLSLELARLTRARRSLLRARAFEDRARFRALTGDPASAGEALAAARLTLDEALALYPGHPLLAEARRSLD
jgi:spermidine synthase